MSDINIKISLAADKAISNTNKLNNSLGKTQTGVQKLQLQLKQSGSAFKSFAGNIAAIGVSKLIGGLVDMGDAFVQSAKDMETMNTQFEILTGSAGAANTLVEELKVFSAGTPFQLQGIAEAAQGLLGFGFAADQVQDKLQKIGDVAAASGKPMKEIALIYGQVSAAGKLTGERLLQFQERAIPIGPAIAKTMGVAESAVKDLVSAGKVSFKDFEKAFASLSQKGGFAFDGMVKRSQTLDGRISTLKDNVSLFAADVAKDLSPALKAATTTMTLWVQEIQKSGVVQEAMNKALSFLPDLIDIVGGSIKFLTSTWNGLSIAVDLIKAGLNSVIIGWISLAEVVLGAGEAINKFLGNDTSGYAVIKENLQGVKDVFTATKNEALASAQATVDNQVAINKAVDNTTKNLKVSLEKETALANKKESEEDKRSRLSIARAKTEADAKAKIKKQSVENFARLEKDTLILATSSNKELAAVGKGYAIYQATIDGYSAIQSAWADVPYPFNIAAAAAVAVSTAANVNKIANTNPSFEQGGIVPGNSFTGDNVQANVNSGEMILNRRQQSQLFDVANGAGAGGGQEIVVHTTVQLDGEAVGKSVSRQVADGLVLGENI